MRTLIPRYAPAWTDHNPSDPAIAIVELFAMLVEGLIYRLNQVPDKHYIAFLNLLGIARNPPTPALTYLTFTAPTGAIVPAGTQAQTVANETEPAIVFETDADAAISPVKLRAAVLVGPYSANPNATTYQDMSAMIVGPPTGKFVLNLAQGQTVQICLGFDAATTDELTMRLLLYRTLAAAQATVTSVYSTGDKDPHEWPAAAAAVDGTDGLQHDGNLRVSVPADWQEQRPSADGDKPGWQKVTFSKVTATDTALTAAQHWIGLRITNTAAATITVGVDRVLFNAATARNALTIRAPERLGSSTGEAFQQFTLAHAPLHAHSGSNPAVEIYLGDGPPGWQKWDVVDDLPAGPLRVCRVDPVTGTVMFGNYDDKAAEGHGAIPAADAPVWAKTYRYVAGGASGNVAAERITVVGTTKEGLSQPAGISAVTNLGPAFDGSDEERVEETLRRAPEVLKTRDRAVTDKDYENLAAATTDVVKVRCLTPKLRTDGTPWTYAGLNRAPGSVYVIIIPDKGPNEARPEPTPNLINEVKDHLDPRRDITASLSVIGPRYLPIKVTAVLNVWKQAGVDDAQLKADTEKLINAYLHPTRGGPNGSGWDAGQPVFASDLFRAIMPPENVAYIASLVLSADLPAYHFPPFRPDGTDQNWDPKERPFELTREAASVRVADYETVCAAKAHAITTRQTD